MIEEVVKTVHRKEVVEKLVEIKVPKIHFIDKPIDVPELRIVDKIVEVDHFQEKVVHKVLKQVKEMLCFAAKKFSPVCRSARRSRENCEN